MSPEILAETIGEHDQDNQDDSAAVTDATAVVSTPEADAEGKAVVAVVPDAVETTLARDTLFELLKNERRREAIDYLKGNDGWATLSDMAEYIAARENDIDVGALTSQQRKRVYIGLYQCHLPKMAAAGVVDFDKNRGTIELQELAAELDPYLAIERGETATADGDDGDGGLDRTSVVGAGIGVLALAGVLGVPGLALLPAAGWVGVCVLTLFVLAGLPLVEER